MMAILNSIGRAVGAASRSKAVMGLAVAGAVTKGLSDTVGQSAIDNAMDIAFDNPEADRAILGTDLTPSLLVSQAGLGPISGAARAMNMDKYGVNMGIEGPMKFGGAVGTVGGAMAGASFGARRGVIGRNSWWSHWWIDRNDRWRGRRRRRILCKCRSVHKKE
jgi:hypothetical protein